MRECPRVFILQPLLEPQTPFQNCSNLKLIFAGNPELPDLSPYRYLALTGPVDFRMTKASGT
jgi:hypothetical protein